MWATRYQSAIATQSPKIRCMLLHESTRKKLDWGEKKEELPKGQILLAAVPRRKSSKQSRRDYPAVELEVIAHCAHMQQSLQNLAGQGHIAQKPRLLALFHQITSLGIKPKDFYGKG